jgi:hypothetical protein
MVIRPGISAAIATESLPSWIYTASYSVMSSSSIHVPADPVRKSRYYDIAFSFDPELALQ